MTIRKHLNLSLLLQHAGNQRMKGAHGLSTCATMRVGQTARRWLRKTSLIRGDEQ